MKIYTNDEKFYMQLYNMIKTFYPLNELEKASILDEDVDISVFFEDLSGGKIAIKKARLLVFGTSIIIDESDKSYAERFINYQPSFYSIIKRALYKELAKITAKSFAWGTLSGVRPSKLYRKIRLNNDEATASDILSEIYMLSDEKIAYLREVYENQRECMARNDELIAYISVPFCPSKCSYCTFTSTTKDEYRTPYIDRLIGEIAQARDKFIATKVLYIGGGTPTYLSDEDFARLIARVAKYAPYDEFTVEAGRPNTINENKLDIMKRYGVTRISINPQSFNEDTLRKVNRKHSVEDIYKAFAMAREKGFSNINMDIILGLPDEDVSDVSRTVDAILKLEPESITAHCLAIKKNNNLSAKYIEKHIKQNEVIRQMMSLVNARLDEAGYEKYYIYRQKNIGGDGENIGYAKKGYANYYNILMMEDICDVFALGAGAVSRQTVDGKIKRKQNTKNLRF